MKNRLKLSAIAFSLMVLGSCSKPEATAPETNEVNPVNYTPIPVENINNAANKASAAVFETFGEYKVTHRYTPDTGWQTATNGTSPNFVFGTFLYHINTWDITAETITLSSGEFDNTVLPYSSPREGVISIQYDNITEEFTMDYEVSSFYDGNALLVKALNDRTQKSNELFWFVKQ